MTFRDDREAAHQRADALQREVDALQREVATLREPPPRRRSRVGLVVGLVGLVFAFAGAGAYLMLGASSSAEVHRAQAVREAELAEHQALETVRRADEARRQQEEMLRHASQEAQRSADEARRAEEAHRPAAEITWRATIDTVEGLALRPGATCTLAGSFVRVERDQRLRELTVRCGDDVLYRSSDDPAHAAPTHVGLREGPVAGAATHVYLLSYDDEEVRPGPRPKVRVSTLGHRVEVWREGDAPMRAMLYVHDVSEPREGDALLDRRALRSPAFSAAVERAGRVLSTRGAAPARAGDRCTFEARPVWEYEENCRIAVRCGGHWIYGQGEAGYLTCELRGAGPVAALDERTTGEGGDPRVTWRGTRVVVSDFTEAGEWRIDIGL